MFNYLQKSFFTLSNSWQAFFLNNCLEELIAIDRQLLEICHNEIIYPPVEQLFAAFSVCDFNDIRVVILGQDPYHGDGEANGLAFAVNSGIKTPPSLRNIFKELELEFGATEKLTGDKLFAWRAQGVLLLNTTLTVIKDKPNSLAHIGWQSVTDKIISEISNRLSNVVFMLWGGFAQKKYNLIDNNRHLILRTTHPSPLSAYRGFLGSNHFKLANQYLIKNQLTPIIWV
jgi:uracil-DNA glycosylase